MNHNFKVDKEKCVKCGQCKDICSTKALDLDENNNPYMKNPTNCMECQHCFAVCPVGAISIMGKDVENSDPVNLINPEDLLGLIKSRRSVRNYKQENVSKDTIEKLKNMLNYSPTGKNAHKLHFSFIEDISVMNDFRGKVNSKLLTILNSKPGEFLSNKIFKKFQKHKNALIKGEDVLFRTAPHLIVASAPIGVPCPTQDGMIALTYFELYANSLGLGTCWCGYLEAILKMFPEFCDYMQVPTGYQPIYVMLFGYPNIEFKRTIQPRKYDFTTIEQQNLEVDFVSKVKRIFWNFIR